MREELDVTTGTVIGPAMPVDRRKAKVSSNQSLLIKPDAPVLTTASGDRSMASGIRFLSALRGECLQACRPETPLEMEQSVLLVTRHAILKGVE